jgi:hypothetical protein
VNHLSPAEIEALVINPQASPDEARRRHLAACPDCARRLADEARLELALHDAATAGPLRVRAPVVARAPWPAPLWRVALPAAAVLALLFTGLAFLTRTSGRSPEPAAALPSSDELCRQDPISLSPGYTAHVPLPPCASAEATAPDRID